MTIRAQRRLLLGVLAGAGLAFALAAAATVDGIAWRRVVSFRLPLGLVVSVGRSW